MFPLPTDEFALEQERCKRWPIDGRPTHFSTEFPMELKGKKIAILATHGFQSELEVPRDRPKKAGATVDVVSLASGEIKGWDIRIGGGR